MQNENMLYFFIYSIFTHSIFLALFCLTTSHSVIENRFTQSLKGHKHTYLDRYCTCTKCSKHISIQMMIMHRTTIYTSMQTNITGPRHAERSLKAFVIVIPCRPRTLILLLVWHRLMYLELNSADQGLCFSDYSASRSPFSIPCISNTCSDCFERNLVL